MCYNNIRWKDILMKNTFFTNKNNIYRKSLLLAVPMMIQIGITNAVGLVDNLMVGSLGTESITAVSIVGQLFFVFSLAIFGGLSGPAIYGAQYYGKGNKGGYQNVFRLKLWISGLVVLVGLIVFSIWNKELIGLYLHGQEKDIDPDLTLRLGVDYLHIMLIQMIPFAIAQVYAGGLREIDESIKPMVAGIASVVTDIVFNYLLIFGKFGFPRLEVRGAALATVLARIVEMSVVVLWTHLGIKKHPFLKGVYKTVLINMKELSIVIKKGFPLFLNEFLWAGGLAAITQCYSMRGLSVVAGVNISNAICNLLNVVFVGLSQAVGIVIGQYLGAGKFEEAKKNSIKLMWFSALLTSFLSIILLFFARVFPEFYDTTRQVKNIGRNFITVTAIFFPLQAYLNTLYFTLRSGGKTVITFVFDSVFTWLVPVSAAFILCKFTSLPILVIFILIQSADIIKVVIGMYLIKKVNWVNRLV